MIYLDRLYLSIYKDIVVDKKNTISGVLFFVSFLYSNLFSFFLNILSIIINYRLMGNVFYNFILFVLIFILNFLVYERFKRREIIMKVHKIIPVFFINILFFISAILFFWSIYINNEFFNH